MIKYHIENVNCIPILPERCSYFAFLALGDKALLDTKYYTSLYEKINHNNYINTSIDNNIKSDNEKTVYNEKTLNDVQDFELPKEWKNLLIKLVQILKMEIQTFMVKQHENIIRRIGELEYKYKHLYKEEKNIDPQTMPPRKKRTAKKKYALVESIRQNTKNGDQ
ncbi:hypothetical protein RhiirA4_478414 [Rhizophagus irregularis]|uniref:Uncharacterized protein n=1 Tax=Rhizophagus irregularis TaxID=588596 RepID=A0A2I1HET2_9GLOM|nr:hypothetical protein RhiirA4_478414 [Rhizophagus irregularis]